jgi:hypothetical protein
LIAVKTLKSVSLVSRETWGVFCATEGIARKMARLKKIYTCGNLYRSSRFSWITDIMG